MTLRHIDESREYLTWIFIAIKIRYMRPWRHILLSSGFQFYLWTKSTNSSTSNELCHRLLQSTVPIQSRPFLLTNHLLKRPSPATEKRASIFSSPVKLNSCWDHLSCHTGPWCLLGHSLHRDTQKSKAITWVTAVTSIFSAWCYTHTHTPHLLLTTHCLLSWLCML